LKWFGPDCGFSRQHRNPFSVTSASVRNLSTSVCSALRPRIVCEHLRYSLDRPRSRSTSLNSATSS